MPLKRTAVLAVSSLIVLGGGATALAATGTLADQQPDAVPALPVAADGALTGLLDGSASGSLQGAIDDAMGDITVDPETGAISGHGFTLQRPVTGADGSATFSGTGPDGQAHSATITPGAEGSRPTITIDGHDLGSMLDGFLAQHPEIRVPDPSAMPSLPQVPAMPAISVPPQVQQFLDQAAEALSGALGGSLPFPGAPRA